MQMGDAVLLDQPQHLLGLETRLQNRQRPFANGMKPIEIRRRVIKRAGDDGPHRPPRDKPQYLAGDHADDLREFRPKVEPPHALRVPGRTRRVDHA